MIPVKCFTLVSHSFGLKGLFLPFSQKCIDQTCYFDRESGLLFCQGPITWSEQLPLDVTAFLWTGLFLDTF